MFKQRFFKNCHNSKIQRLSWELWKMIKWATRYLEISHVIHCVTDTVDWLMKLLSNSSQACQSTTVQTKCLRNCFACRWTFASDSTDSHGHCQYELAWYLLWLLSDMPPPWHVMACGQGSYQHMLSSGCTPKRIHCKLWWISQRLKLLTK